ncbi:MAG: prefoldin subunit alpha [Candidatus Aenigmarchaeota archaeon]|nr:prefoldin subunit alpha [Candidatus Aenigmarchaeota archaeon]
MIDEKVLQEKMLVYKTLESRLNAFVKQGELVSSKIAEIMSTISSIEEVEKNKDEVLFKLGSESYISGRITGGNVLVEIGAGVVLEKPLEEGKEILHKRKEELESALNEIQKGVAETSEAMGKLASEINEIAHAMQMQNRVAE